MKARVVRRGIMYQLLLCNGIIKTLLSHEVAEFFKTYGDESHYTGEGTWDYAVSMEDFEGDTLAVVTEEGFLVIYDADFFNSIMEVKVVNYLSLPEYAERYNRNYSYIRRMASEGRIPGAIQKSGRWIVPENAGYPKDKRESWYRKKDPAAPSDEEIIRED